MFLLPSPSTAITVELPGDIALSLFRNYPTHVPNAMFSDNQRWPPKRYYRRKEWRVLSLGTSLTIIQGSNIQHLFIYNVLQQREVNAGKCVCKPSVSKCLNKLSEASSPHQNRGKKISCTQIIFAVQPDLNPLIFIWGKTWNPSIMSNNLKLRNT